MVTVSRPVDGSPMDTIPIIAHHSATASPSEVGNAERLADRLVQSNKRLLVPEAFRTFVPTRLLGGRTLHIDDLGKIPALDRFHDVTYLQERARLRALDGDLVASCTARFERYEQYCEELLGLGRVIWLHPPPHRSPLSTVAACWHDRETRNTIRRAVEASDEFYIHPHQGVFPIWALAALLDRSCRTPIKVIAPHPGLCDAVNDKTWFTHVVQMLFGANATPRSATAWNLASVANIAQIFATSANVVVVKIPDSAGGAGNFLLDADELLRQSLGAIRRLLRERLEAIGWDGTEKFLVSSWETDVLSTPSAQLWIPPESEGEPIVEAVLEQLIEGREGLWYGSKPPTFDAQVLQRVVNGSWLLGRIFQRLGYVGRCSFDLLVVGKTFGASRVEFVECNGRWGGTSLPMTLMNRLFGDWQQQPYVHRSYTIGGLSSLTFDHLESCFSLDLFDVTTGRGNLILLNPTMLREASAIDVVALGRNLDAAVELAEAIPDRLRACVDGCEPAWETPKLSTASR